MGGRKLRLKREKNLERKAARLASRPKGRPPKRGTSRYHKYKEKVYLKENPKNFIVYIHPSPR